MRVSVRGAARLLLSVNLILLFGFIFTLIFILLENSADLYGWVYDATYTIQTVIVYSWFLSIGLSPILAIALSICFGYKIRKTIEWKSSMTIIVIAGLPSLTFVGLGFAMVYYL
jgi:hypothetical protein